MLCLSHGKHVLCEKPFTISDCYTPEDSMAIGKLLYDIRKSSGMHFMGEED